VSLNLSADLTRRQFVAACIAILLVAGFLRSVWLTADPPWHAPVGVFWHDEGAWLHNARNKALFGAWALDAWNPMYIAPVFTGLEYASFSAFGVGVWQARLVSDVLGSLSVLFLGLGVARIAGRRAGMIAAALLATNYVYVMWNRTAMMEGPMTAFIVFAWYCYVRAAEAGRWAWGAAVFALLAFFTKAAAAFFVGAVALDALVVLLFARKRPGVSARAAWIALGALTLCGTAALALFVLPNWREYQFYNWQMSVTRKPRYDLESLLFRITGFPVLHDLFTRMWVMLLLCLAALMGLVARWRSASAGERLLGYWVALGTLELLVHDVGNERRFVFFIPAVIALASILLARDRALLPAAIAQVPRSRALLALPLVAYALYVASASIVRVLFLYQVRPNVRIGAAVAVVLTTVIYATWPRVPAALSRLSWSPRAAGIFVGLACGWQTAQFAQWAASRTYENYEASRLIGRTLPPGTLVHGKLANGLSLENRIRPVFIGHSFGNFEDRKSRDDVRYILTYIEPRIGYEGSQILDVLDAYPHRRIIMTFDVAETATGHDRAALIDKFGGITAGIAPPAAAPQTAGREKN
jgi:4-amino-4-deoxy-L-arabinose transferase-like glycosyltransferase